MRNTYGPGHIFEWDGEFYTTDYAEEVNVFSSITFEGGQWVLNADDLDDFCASNYHDECGICDGNGPMAWYFDNDGDGLGNANRVKVSCNQPVASN